jgi:tetratricopeptide (TPR) repeat protein
MAYWGQAYALGPNINDPFPDDERKNKCNEALAKAEKLASRASPKEQALIDALTARYDEDPGRDISELNMAYMNAMAEVVKKYPKDADIQTLYAASVMNTMPWNYWDNAGKAAPNTLKGKEALELAMQLNPDHPGAHHYYIHMVELPKPDLAVPSAEKLGSLMPAAGHLVHMPSHIFIRVGRYLDAVEANKKAILADEDYISQCYSQGMYPLGYYPHNLHFLWSASSLLGASDNAIDAAKKTAEKVPLGELKTLHFLQDFASTPLLAYTRFGKWNEILTIPYPGDDYKHLKLVWHYSRGIAFLRKDNLKEAKEELEAITAMIKDPELEGIIANYTNPTSAIALVAQEVIRGEIAMAEGNRSKAIDHLKKAVELEDALVYSEPAAWHIPVRQSLGAVLLTTEDYAEAEKIYREDLDNLRQNGWSLMGLYKSLIAQDKVDEANKIKEEFRKAWEHADIEIETSIL